MKTAKQLIQTPFGSHLYGTNGPQSDFDFKVLVLPSIDSLILGISPTNYVIKPDGVGSQDSMPAGEAEYEYIPLQVFLNHFLEGQTYAVEMAFAVLQDKFKTFDQGGAEEWNLDVQEWMTELVERFLTRNVQKMVGYAVAQSNLYGLKTNRYSALVRINEIINEYFGPGWRDFKPTTKILDLPDLVGRLMSEHPEFVSHGQILNAKGGRENAPSLDVINKQFPMTVSWQAVCESIGKTIEKYGDRVKQFEGKGTDWKALSHAIRITEQIIELCTTGKIIFPRPNAQFLMDVKGGKLPLSEATDYLSARFNEIDAVTNTTFLQERTPELQIEFDAFKLNLLQRYYNI